MKWLSVGVYCVTGVYTAVCFLRLGCIRKRASDWAVVIGISWDVACGLSNSVSCWSCDPFLLESGELDSSGSRIHPWNLVRRRPSKSRSWSREVP
jgi:hypothetical protein